MLRQRALVAAMVGSLNKIVKAIVETSRSLADLRKPECFRGTGEAMRCVICGIQAFGVPVAVCQVAPRI